VRVYCLPHAGGTAGSYLSWVRSHQVPGIRFEPVELPGRGTRFAEPPLTSMDAVVDGLVAMLAQRPERESFLLFGHSMGAKIAYETTRRLAAAGRPLPRAIVVSGSRPPDAPVAVPMPEQTDSELLERVVALGGVPAELLAHPGMMNLLLPALRADLTLVARYTEQVRPTAVPCPVVAFTGAEDRHSGPQWVGGWRSTTSGWFHHRIFPGDHFFLPGQAAEVIAEIARVAQRSAPQTGNGRGSTSP
jgi:surfactin synthase thioesterase subunit